MARHAKPKPPPSMWVLGPAIAVWLWLLVGLAIQFIDALQAP